MLSFKAESHTSTDDRHSVNPIAATLQIAMPLDPKLRTPPESSGRGTPPTCEGSVAIPQT